MLFYFGSLWSFEKDNIDHKLSLSINLSVQGGIGIQTSLDELAATCLKFDYTEPPRLVSLGVLKQLSLLIVLVDIFSLVITRMYILNSMLKCFFGLELT